MVHDKLNVCGSLKCMSFKFLDSTYKNIKIIKKSGSYSEIILQIREIISYVQNNVWNV